MIDTSNPSGDDNLFLAVIKITAEAAVTTEICDDGIDNDGDGLVDAADPDCAPPPPTNNPPVCDNVVPNVFELWPPNHKFQLVSFDGATDPDGDPVVLSITGVTQDEPLTGEGTGNTKPDAKLGPAANEVSLRAERSGQGDGRVYRVNLTATDDEGAMCSVVRNVSVVHDQRPGGMAIDSGGVFDSLTP